MNGSEVWILLGIEETKDKRAITRAYRDRLTAVNPEEKPQEFMELREAYEKALALAEQETVPAEEKSPVELWQDELAALYQNLRTRLDPDSWKELLGQDICQALDGRELVEEALLNFLMENFRIPQEIMICLNDAFSWTDRIDELAEKYPRDFLEYVIADGVRYPEGMPLAMFTPGRDGAAADRYISLVNSVARSESEQLPSIYDQMKNSPEIHPYGEALLAKVAVEEGDTAGVQKLMELHLLWPEDTHLTLDLAYACKLTGDLEQMEECANEALALHPELRAARQFLVEAKRAREDYHGALDELMQLQKDNQGDMHFYYQLEEQRREISQKYEKQLAERLEADPADDELRYELAWCYMDCGDAEQSAEVARDLSCEKPDKFSYYNLRSSLAKLQGDYETALAMERKLLEAVKELQPDGTNRTLARMKRGPEVKGRISTSCYLLGRFEEAVAMGEEAIEDDPSDLMTFANVIRLHLELKHDESAAALADRYLLQAPRSAEGYYLKAAATYRMRRDDLAFDAVNTALELDPSNLSYYLLKLQILTRNNAIDAANALVDFLVQNGIEDDPCVSSCKIEIYMSTRPKEEDRDALEETLRLAEHVSGQLDSGEYGKPSWAADFYNNYATLTSDLQNFTREYPVEPILALLDKGLAMDPENYGCCSYKAWLLKKSGKNEEALAIFRELEKLPRRNLYIESQLAELCYDDLANKAEEALHYYQLLLGEYPENPEYCFYAGMCCMRLGKLAEAEEYFAMEQKYGPDDIDGFFRMAYVYLAMNRLDDALLQAEKTVEMAKQREKDTVRFFIPLINCYRRMGRPKEAIEAIGECRKYNPIWKVQRRIFDVYLQFGMFAEAEKQLKLWKKDKEEWDMEKWYSASCDLLVLQKQFTRLTLHQINYASVKLEESTQRRLDAIHPIYKGNFRKYLKTAKRNFDQMIEAGDEYSHIRGDYVWALWLAGQPEEAREQAQIALDKLDESVKLATGDRLINQCKRIQMLAILGREEEARAAADALEHAPMCDHCAYGSCKDLQVFRVNMEMVFGNYEKALELIREGLEKWPDEADFIENELVIAYQRKKNHITFDDEE